MAHNLATDEQGQERFAYANCTPWHGLGTDAGGLMTSEEALRKARLDFQVEKVPLYLQDGTQAPGAFATRILGSRSAEGYLGTVGDKFCPLQNVDALAVCDPLIKEGFLFKTVGALGKGERVWMLMQHKDKTVEIVKGDPIETFMLFTNAHDGNSSFEARSTSVTVVCQNTLGMATSGNAAGIKIRHTTNVLERTRLAIDIAAAHAKHQKSWVEAMKYLAKHPITDAVIQAFELTMFGDVEKTPEGRGMTILTNKLEQFEHLMLHGKGTEIPGRVGNLYGLVQAYTEWSDWMSQVKGEDRTNSIVYGNGNKQKAQALQLALVLAKKGA